MGCLRTQYFAVVSKECCKERSEVFKVYIAYSFLAFPFAPCMGKEPPTKGNIFSHTFAEKIENSMNVLPMCKLFPTLLAYLSHTASSVANAG